MNGFQTSNAMKNFCSGLSPNCKIFLTPEWHQNVFFFPPFLARLFVQSYGLSIKISASSNILLNFQVGANWAKFNRILQENFPAPYPLQLLFFLLKNPDLLIHIKPTFTPYTLPTSLWNFCDSFVKISWPLFRILKTQKRLFRTLKPQNKKTDKRIFVKRIT